MKNKHTDYPARWISEGRDLTIEEMDNGHLINAIAWIEKRAWAMEKAKALADCPEALADEVMQCACDNAPAYPWMRMEFAIRKGNPFDIIKKQGTCPVVGTRWHVLSPQLIHWYTKNGIYSMNTMNTFVTQPTVAKVDANAKNIFNVMKTGKRKIKL